MWNFVLGLKFGFDSGNLFIFSLKYLFNKLNSTRPALTLVHHRNLRLLPHSLIFFTLVILMGTFNIYVDKIRSSYYFCLYK